MRFKRADDGNWRGLDGYMAGEPLKVVADHDGRPQALDMASSIYTRTPYDPDAAVPDGVDQAGWHAPSPT